MSHAGLTLQHRFNHAIIEHFEDQGYPDQIVDAGDVCVAAATILVSYCRAIHPKSREDVLERIIRQMRADVLGAGNA